MQPYMFDACGLMQVEERGMPYYGDDTVIPSETWPTVTDFLNDVTGVSCDTLSHTYCMLVVSFVT